MEKMVLKGIREIAEFLGVSVNTVEELVKRPDFPAGKIGKCYIVSVPHLLDWIANGGTEQKGVA